MLAGAKLEAQIFLKTFSNFFCKSAAKNKGHLLFKEIFKKRNIILPVHQLSKVENMSLFRPPFLRLQLESRFHILLVALQATLFYGYQKQIIEKYSFVN